MAEPRLYLLRHGQTIFNTENKLGGDSDLTEEGIASADAIADSLKAKSFLAIYCSPLKRSLDTAEIVRRHHRKTPLFIEQELAEISAGDFDSMTYDEFERRYPLLYESRKKDKYHWAFPNGESYDLAAKRVGVFLDSLVGIDGDFAVVGHQGINRLIIGLLDGASACDIPYISVPNDVVFEIGLASRKVCRFIDGKKLDGFDILKY